MPETWYFLSHARLDSTNDAFNCIEKFYEDLDKEVRRLQVIPDGVAGFFDGRSLQQGSYWPMRLVDALSTCRSLICMYSPAFFDSEYCGREWQIFNSRLPVEEPRPPLILPVLLSPPEELATIPQALKDIQYADDEYPSVYRENGLLYLMRRDSQREAYRDFIDALVRRLRSVAEQYRVPDLTPRPDIASIKSAFHQTEAPPTDAGTTRHAMPVADNFGPRYAEFVYVAARKEEVPSIQPIPPKTDCYGDEGELDWKPYWPHVETEVGLFAQRIATREGFRYSKISLDEDLVKQIKAAQANKRIVVVVVDTWTLCIDRYCQIMKQYDNASFWNSVVLIVWNDKDEEVTRNRLVLQQALQEAFNTRLIIKDERYFIDNVGSASQLESHLSIALQTVRMQIINKETRFKQMTSGPSRSKPEISGPGGDSL
ncbi:MAG TPA: TIR-like protein FxsC [Pyrinomonadaceae bacterium]|nr:TIR-like protein FxsC [Pyrinomonadaceae bacterium]